MPPKMSPAVTPGWRRMLFAGPPKRPAARMPSGEPVVATVRRMTTNSAAANKRLLRTSGERSQCVPDSAAMCDLGRLGPDLGQRTLELLDDQILAAEDDAVPLGFEAAPQPFGAARILG